MRLFEYEAKEILRWSGIPCQQGLLVRNETQADSLLPSADYPVVLKAQVLAGGRGRAGGILFAETPSEALEKTRGLLGKMIRGFPVRAVLVEKKQQVEREIYLGVTIDRLHYKQVVVAGARGGVDIEERAQQHREEIVRCHLDPDQKFYSFLGVSLGKAIGLGGEELRSFATVAKNLVAAFRRYDAKLLEINPLALTTDGSLLALDARMSIDDDALFRQEELASWGLTERHEEGELTEREKKARSLGIPYLDLDGDIGMFPGGAGFGIMGNDFIVHYGGRPANFMDSGGGPSPERLANMLSLLDENPKVKVIFAARFGGISRCDDFARGVVKFLREHGLSKPMVMRMTGNMWKEGLAIFAEAKEENPELFSKVKLYGIERPIEDVAREAIEAAKKISGEGENGDPGR